MGFPRQFATPSPLRRNHSVVRGHGLPPGFPGAGLPPLKIRCRLLLVLVLAVVGLHAADPVVSNVRASQRAGTKLIDIVYDVADADTASFSVSVRISSDGGTTWTVPCANVSGNGVGTDVVPGTDKAIVWNAGADWNGQWSEQMRVEVTADDTPAEFVLIPSGTNSGTDPDFGDYSLTVPTLYMGRTEVTKAKWDTVRAWGLSNGYTDLPEGGGTGANHPVHSVNWYDCVKWCNARSEKEGRTPCYTVSGNVYRTGESDSVACATTAAGYRLPTDTEWEYAARGGLSDKRFPWGDTIAHSQANYKSSSSYSYDVSPTRGYHPDHDDGGTPYTSPVGSFAANGSGLHDTAGNVWEWCWDWHPGYVDSWRVLRGGGWGNYAYRSRVGERGRNYPSSRIIHAGFRVCSAAEFVLIPGGTNSGTDPDSGAYSLTVPALYMGRTEVTKAKWDAVRAWGLANGYTDLPAGGGKGANHPVHTVNWYDCLKWCNARSQMEGRTPCYTLSGSVYKTGESDSVAYATTAAGYRLPTDTEWEYAARGGLSGKRFPWGDTITHSQANYKSSSSFSYDVSPTRGYHPDYDDGGTAYTSPAGSFAANGSGLHDTAGNAYEWCWDWAPGYVGSHRVLRGGGWDTYAYYCRVGNRYGGYPYSRYNWSGFRVCASTAEFALIPGGTNSGTNPLAPGESHDSFFYPENYSLTVSSFYMGRMAVTKGKWDAVRAWGLANGYGDLPAGGGKGQNHPVHTVSWYDCVKWCNARSEKEGRTPCYTLSGSVYKTGESDSVACVASGSGYRLPTDTEWEYAARGGLSGKRFPWGDTITHSQANYQSSSSYSYDTSPTRGYHPDYDDGGYPYTSPAGSFAANGYGLHDMAGNVYGWCWDWHPDYVGSGRVFRGGGWGSGASDCRAGSRSWIHPDHRSFNIGFRVCHTAELVLIPGGTNSGTDPDFGAYSLTVPAFYMGRTEVTKATWDAVRAWGLSNGYTDLPAGGGTGADHPVQTVNWYDCVKWCNARSQMEGRTPCYTLSGSVYKTGESDNVTCATTAAGYRLPTDTEWEYAARGGLSGKRFPWGDTITHSQANYNSTSPYFYDVSPTRGYHPDYDNDKAPYTSPVGSFAANGSGLHDTAGNVWEWCWGWHPGYVGSIRVTRGGSWGNYVYYCRVGYRGGSSPHYRYGNGGFRVCSAAPVQ